MDEVGSRYPRRWLADALRGTAALIGIPSLALSSIAAAVVGFVIAREVGRTAADVWGEFAWFLFWLAGLAIVSLAVLVVQLLLAPARIEAREREAAAQRLAAVQAERDQYSSELKELRSDIENRELRFALSVEGSRLIAVDDSGAARDAWLDSRTRELLEPLPPPVPDYLKGIFTNLPGSMTGGDTPGEFRAAVQQYINEVGARWSEVIARRLIENRVSRICIAVSNPTDRRFEDFVLTVLLPEGFLAGWDGTDENWEFIPPAAPAPWGSQTPRMPWYSSQLPDLGNLTLNSSTADIQRVNGRLRVTFAPVDLHQRAEGLALEELNVVVPSALAGESVRVDYFATARDTRGQTKGSFELIVAPTLLPVATLLAVSAETSDSDEDG